MNILNLFKQSFLAKTIIILAVMLTGGANFVWGDELTLYDNSDTNGSIPVAGSMGSSYAPTAQFIIPASDIECLLNSKITKLTFYSTTETVSWGTAEIDVYIKEVDNTTFSSKALVDWGTMSTVFSGALSVSSNKMEIDLSASPYVYKNEKSLLIGFVRTKTGSTNNLNWKGKKVSDNVGVNTSYGSVVYAAFLPKITFSYDALADPILSISPNESASFGSVSANSSKTYTISNMGAGLMTVNFTNTNTTDFSVLNSSNEVITSLSDIVNGSPQTFKIRFNYNSENLGDKSATIKVIPTYDENDSIKIVASATARSNNDPQLSVSPNENFDFGTVTANASKTYTITNIGTGTMNVTITSSNTDYFTLSSNDFTEETTTIESIAAGESAEFTVNFKYTCAIANFGSHNSTITVTPSYNSEAAVSWDITANATADVVIDETQATTWSSGSGKSVWVKYQPQNGWNTLIIPFSTSTNLASIFGSGAKAYKLNSFSDEGEISFSKYSKNEYIGANVPCLVYIENAPDNSSGVLLTGTYVYYASNATPGSVSKSNSKSKTVTFKGTFAPIAAPGMEGKYGVTTAGKLGKGNSSASIKGFRAYIEVDGATSSRLSIVFDDEENQTTDLGFVKLIDKDAKDVFNLQGQKVKKATKGIYIVNGRKVIIK